MEEAKFRRLKSICIKLVNLTAFICIASFIANIPFPIRNSGMQDKQGKSNISKKNSPIILLYTTIAEVQSTESPVLSESETKTETELQETEKLQKKSDNNENQKSDDFEAKSDKNIESSIKSNTKTNTEQPEEWESIEMRVTAYCPCPICCGEYSDGVTACGHKIQPGDTFVAADKRFPFYTEMLIPGYSNSQPVKVLDRGGAIKGNRLDVFFATHEEALEWGVHYLKVNVRRISL